MKRIHDILQDMNRLIDQHALEDFIARGWVCPIRDETDYVFDEVDVARIRLVCELRIDMNFEIDAIDFILSLMDQLYDAKAFNRNLMKAVEAQPDEVQKAIIEALGNTQT